MAAVILHLGIAVCVVSTTVARTDIKNIHDDTALLQLETKTVRQVFKHDTVGQHGLEGPVWNMPFRFDQSYYNSCKKDLNEYAVKNVEVLYHGWTSKCGNSSLSCTVHGDRACIASPRQIMRTDIQKSISGLNSVSTSSGSRNPMFRDKIMRIRAPIWDGFFTRAIFVMITGSWAAANRIPFFVDMDEVNYDPTNGIGSSQYLPTQQRFDAYFDTNVTGDRWEQFFKPPLPMNMTKADVYKAVADDRIVELAPETAWWYFLNYSNGDGGQESTYPQSFAAAINSRTRRAAQVESWVRPNDESLKAAAHLWQSVTETNSTKPLLVLGVHVRGLHDPVPPAAGKTLVSSPAAFPPDIYWPLIDRYIEYHEPAANVRIFFASDNPSYIDTAINRYGARAYTQTKVPRSQGKIWHEDNLFLAHRKGVTALIDTLALSKCNFLLKSASTLSEFAIYYNPSLIFNSIDLSIPDQPMAEWAMSPTNKTVSPIRISRPASPVPFVQPQPAEMDAANRYLTGQDKQKLAVQSGVGAQAKADTQAKVDAEVKADAQAKIDVKAKADAQAEIDAKAKADAQATADASAKADAQAEAEATLAEAKANRKRSWQLAEEAVDKAKAQLAAVLTGEAPKASEVQEKVEATSNASAEAKKAKAEAKEAESSSEASAEAHYNLAAKKAKAEADSAQYDYVARAKAQFEAEERARGLKVQSLAVAKGEAKDALAAALHEWAAAKGQVTPGGPEAQGLGEINDEVQAELEADAEIQELAKAKTEALLKAKRKSAANVELFAQAPSLAEARGEVDAELRVDSEAQEVAKVRDQLKAKADSRQQALAEAMSAEAKVNSKVLANEAGAKAGLTRSASGQDAKFEHQPAVSILAMQPHIDSEGNVAIQTDAGLDAEINKIVEGEARGQSVNLIAGQSEKLIVATQPATPIHAVPPNVDDDGRSTAEILDGQANSFAEDWQQEGPKPTELKPTNLESQQEEHILAAPNLDEFVDDFGDEEQQWKSKATMAKLSQQLFGASDNEEQAYADAGAHKAGGVSEDLKQTEQKPTNTESNFDENTASHLAEVFDDFGDKEQQRKSKATMAKLSQKLFGTSDNEEQADAPTLFSSKKDDFNAEIEKVLAQTEDPTLFSSKPASFFVGLGKGSAAKSGTRKQSHSFGGIE